MWTASKEMECRSIPKFHSPNTSLTKPAPSFQSNSNKKINSKRPTHNITKPLTFHLVTQKAKFKSSF